MRLAIARFPPFIEMIPFDYPFDFRFDRPSATAQGMAQDRPC